MEKELVSDKANHYKDKNSAISFPNIVSILKRRYPLVTNGYPAKDGLFAAVAVFLLLFLLQPFGINEYHGNKLVVCLAFGLVTYICCLVLDYFIAVPLQKHVSTWKIWHQALTVFVEILTIGMFHFMGPFSRLGIKASSSPLGLSKTFFCGEP